MKIIVTGASTYGVDNMGDDAMFSALIKSLKKKYSKCEIVFLARHPSKDFDKLFGLKSIKNLDHDSNSAAFGRFFLGLNKGDNRSNLNDIYKELSSADSLIIGGNSLMEISENTFLRGVSTYSTGCEVVYVVSCQSGSIQTRTFSVHQFKIIQNTLGRCFIVQIIV